MAQRDWTRGWPNAVMQVGAVIGAAGMVMGALTQQSRFTDKIFTFAFSAVFALLVWLVAWASWRRLRLSGGQGLPEREPKKLTVVLLVVIAVVMWMVGIYGAVIALQQTMVSDAWYALGYCGVALVATGAAFMVRILREEWLAHYRRGWPGRHL